MAHVAKDYLQTPTQRNQSIIQSEYAFDHTISDVKVTR